MWTGRVPCSTKRSPRTMPTGAATLARAGEPLADEGFPGAALETPVNLEFASKPAWSVLTGIAIGRGESSASTRISSRF